MKGSLPCLFEYLGGQEESKAEGGGGALAEKLAAQTSQLNQVTRKLAET